MKKTKTGLLLVGSMFALTFGGVLSSCAKEPDVSSSKGNEGTTDVGLTLSETSVTLNVGGTKTVTATTESEGNYLIGWQTSDKTVATVKAGTITGISEGTATITASVRKKGSTRVLQSKEVSVTVTDHSITLSETEVNISISESATHKLSATVQGGSDTLTWSSNNEEVASVDQTGLVTGHKRGDAIITVTNGEVSAQCAVHVFANHFGLDKKASIAINQTLTLTVTGTPSSDAKWSSEDPSIATVENGVVTAKKIGMTTIHLTSQEDAVDATCVVMVKGEGEEAAELPEGQKADATKNPGSWFYLKEDKVNVTVGSTPTIDNGLISVDITHVGTETGELSGTNFFYLRYQPDAVGDMIYDQTLYIYAESAGNIQVNGEGIDLTVGLNKIERSFTSSAPNENNPSQIKFRCTGKFQILATFEKTGEVKKMTLSESKKKLDLSGEKSFTLTANVPDDAAETTIHWESSDAEVAVVENGVVTGLKVGVATITATCGQYSAACQITVEDSSVDDPRTDLPWGKNDEVLAHPETWYYFADASTINTLHKLGEDGKTIDINAVGAGSKFVYLRYAAKENATYTASYSIFYKGTQESESASVEFSYDNVKEHKENVAVASNETKGGTYDFVMDGSKPFQLKFKNVGTYQFVITIAKKA